MGIKKLKTKFRFHHNLYNQTAHSIERTSRFLVAESIEPGYKHIIGFFEVDRGHPDGTEVHVVTEHGIVYIFNKNSQKLITCLIARPRQLQRYFDAVGGACPQTAYNFAKEHERQRLNN